MQRYSSDLKQIRQAIPRRKKSKSNQRKRLYHAQE